MSPTSRSLIGDRGSGSPGIQAINDEGIDIPNGANLAGVYDVFMSIDDLGQVIAENNLDEIGER